MRPSWSRTGPKLNEWRSYKRNLDRGKQTYRDRRWLHEREPRSWSDGSTSQGMPRLAGHHQKLGKGQKDSSQSLWRDRGCSNTLILDFELSKLRENKFPSFKPHFVLAALGNPNTSWSDSFDVLVAVPGAAHPAFASGLSLHVQLSFGPTTEPSFVNDLLLVPLHSCFLPP